VNQLPPPPPGPPPLQPGVAWAPTPAADLVPQWRRATAGWVLLNIVIGIGVGVGTFIVVWIFVVAGHVDLQSLNETLQSSQNANTLTPETQRIVAAIGGALLLALAGGLTGWLLFAYLRVRASVRLTLLVAIPLVAALIGYGLMSGNVPKLPGY
jgi:hypothetical protein